MQQFLGETVDTQFGYYSKYQREGEVKYLLASHFDENGQLTKFEKSFISYSDKLQRFLLKENDVILTGKGLRLFAWAYQKDFGRVIPSSLFYLLRPKTDVFLGQFLAYYLNTARMQHELKQIGAGGTMLSIPKKELMQLKINIPSLKEQHRIVKIANLVDQDIALAMQLLEKKKALKKGLINHLVFIQSKFDKQKKP